MFLCIREKEVEDLKGICMHLIEKQLHLKVILKLRKTFLIMI